MGGSEEAAQFVSEQPFGKVLLVLLGVGMAGYAVWRCVVGIKDTERHGQSGVGVLKRAGAVMSGLINAALVVAIFQLAMGSSSGGGSSDVWVAKVMDQPLGVFVIGATGAVTVGVGAYQFYLAYTKKFLEHLGLSQLSGSQRDWVTRLGQVGHAARGVVFPIIGVALVQAALRHSPGEAKGVREALLDIAGSSSGPVLLGIVAAGFIAYGAFMVLSAKFRRCAV